VTDLIVAIALRAGMTFVQFDRAARREYWTTLLRETDGNLREVARLAACPRTTASDQMRALGIQPRTFKVTRV
jgi:DNA-binding NtrC family response regulator